MQYGKTYKGYSLKANELIINGKSLHEKCHNYIGLFLLSDGES